MVYHYYHYPLPTTHHLPLPTTNYPLPTTYHLCLQYIYIYIYDYIYNLNPKLCFCCGRFDFKNILSDFNNDFILAILFISGLVILLLNLA